MDIYTYIIDFPFLNTFPISIQLRTPRFDPVRLRLSWHVAALGVIPFACCDIGMVLGTLGW